MHLHKNIYCVALQEKGRHTYKPISVSMHYMARKDTHQQEPSLQTGFQ